MSEKGCSSVGIIGGGIQGACIGLQLLKKNIPTTIFDRNHPNDPGMMASYGNAGHFSPYAVLQLNRPDILYDIPKMIFSSWSIGSKMNYIPKMLPWIFHIKIVTKNRCSYRKVYASNFRSFYERL